MATADWYSITVNIIKSILAAVWSGITYLVKIIIGLPDWIKGIIFGILILIMIFLFCRLRKSLIKQEWRFIDP